MARATPRAGQERVRAVALPAPLRDGHLRRLRRPHQAQADSGALQPGAAEPAAQGLRDRRPRVDRDELRGLPREARTRAAASSSRSRSISRSGAGCAERIIYVTGSFEDPATYDRLASALRAGRRARSDRRQRTSSTWRRRPTSSPSSSAASASAGLATTARTTGRPGLPPGGHREALRPRPRVGAGAEPRPALGARASARSTASITTSARRRCRTSSSSASPTASSSRSGTAATSTTCRSPSPRRVGVEQRGGYYDQAGALRDMVQNHIFQLLALIAMEPPISFAGEAVRDEKAKVLDAIQPMRPEDGARAHRARSVRPGTVPPRPSEPRSGARLPRRAQGGPGFAHRDLRRDEAPDRQLALGRRAVLPAHRQAPAAPRHRDRDPVQARAADPVPRHRRRDPALQPAGAAHPARRRHLAALRRQGAGPGPRTGGGRDGFRLRRTTSARRPRPATRRCSTTA